MMEWIYLELKLLSCRDLKAFNFLRKLSVYVVVSMFSDKPKIKEQQQQYLQRLKTPVDRKGGGNPEWNHMMQFDVKGKFVADHSDNLFLKFDLRCDGVIFGKRTIGEVRVPFKDLIEEFDGNIRFVSYQVRNSDGKPNGVLNFSYKVNGGEAKAKKNGMEIDSSSVVGLSSSRVDVLQHQKVHYPSVQVDDVVQSKTQEKSFYPSLDDITCPSPKTSVPLPQFYKPVQELYCSVVPAPLPLQQPVLAVGQGLYYQPLQHPWPFVQAPGPGWYTTKENGL